MIIVFLIAITIILLALISKCLIEIKFHLSGIDNKTITSVSDVPEVHIMNDENEWLISQARDKEKGLENEHN